MHGPRGSAIKPPSPQKAGPRSFFTFRRDFSARISDGRVQQDGWSPPCRREVDGEQGQAARTVSRKRSSSLLSRLLSVDKERAAASTCVDAEPVSAAPCSTSVTFDETSCVPCAACWMLREISWVAAPCSSTAAAMVDDTSDNRSLVAEMSRIALTDSWVAVWMP